VQEYVKRLGSHHKLTSAFHPRTNGKVERYNGTVKNMLRKYVQGALHRWDEFVEAAVWSSRVWKNATTGYSPFFLVYGREPRLPGDAIIPFISKESMQDPKTVADVTARELESLGQHRAAAQARMKAVSDKDKERWDKSMGIVDYEVGDLVLLTHEGKFGLEPRFKGPYIITQVFNDYGTYQLETMAGQKVDSLVHRDRLKRAKGDKPDEAWYDPTASRRQVKAATTSRSGRVLRASLPSFGKGGGGSSYAATAGFSSSVRNEYVNIDRINDATAPSTPTSIIPVSNLPTATTSTTIIENSTEEPECSSNIYENQNNVLPFVDTTAFLPAKVIQQEQQNSSQCFSNSGMSDVDGDGNSAMEEDPHGLQSVVEGYDDISSYDDEYSSAMSDIAVQYVVDHENEYALKAVIDGYADISEEEDNQKLIIGDIADTGSEEKDIEEEASKDIKVNEEEKKKQEELPDKNVVVPTAAGSITKDDVTLSDELVHNKTNSSHGEEQAVVGAQDNKETISSQEEEMEEVSDHSNKLEEDKGSSGSNQEQTVTQQKIFSPFAFVEKQSRKPLSRQKYRGTDDSIHDNEDTVGIEDVEGPTSVSKGDNVCQRLV